MSNDKVLSNKDIDNIWRSVKSVSPDDAKHMIKSAYEEGIHKINKDKDKNKEEKSNDGKVEGDVSNGIEGRIKKKIQT